VFLVSSGKKAGSSAVDFGSARVLGFDFWSYEQGEAAARSRELQFLFQESVFRRPFS
jgi:hypothetical protein